MKIHKLHMQDYTAFAGKHELEIRPLTILIGSHGSGKSALAQIPMLVHELFTNMGDMRAQRGFMLDDMLHGQTAGGRLELGMTFEHEGQSLTARAAHLGGGTPAKLSLTHADSTPIPVEGIERWPAPHYLPMQRSSLTVKQGQRRGTIYAMSVDHLHAAFESEEGRRICREVSMWFEQNFGGRELVMAETPSGLRLMLRSRGSSFAVPLMRSGSAGPQVLPVVLHAKLLAANPHEAPLIVEQPESNLHPDAHGALADLFVGAVNAGGSAIVETHSEVFCLRVQRRIAEGLLDPSKAIIHWLKAERPAPSEQEDAAASEAKMLHITVDQQGKPSAWPKGVFSEGFVESKAILKVTQHRDTMQLATSIKSMNISEKGEPFIWKDGRRIRYWPPGVFSEEVDEISVLHDLKTQR